MAGADQTPRFLVDVARLDPEGEYLEGETGDILELDEKFVIPLGGVMYNLFVQLLDTELLVRGEIAQDFDFVCSRCMETFGKRIKVPDFTTSIEVSEKKEFVDLTDELREGIILALPTFPVCRQDCKGLCVRCGKNLNEGACGCENESGDSRWGALDALNLA